MPKLTGLSPWARELCEAIGEGSSKVRKITLVCEVDDAVRVTVERFVDGDDGARVLQVIRKVVWEEETTDAE